MAPHDIFGLARWYRSSGAPPPPPPRRLIARSTMLRSLTQGTEHCYALNTCARCSSSSAVALRAAEMLGVD